MNIGKHFTAQNGVEQREQESGNGEGAGSYSVHVGFGRGLISLRVTCG
jgi:hypothetical protein